jgi:hypothetical protein
MQRRLLCSLIFYTFSEAPSTRVPSSALPANDLKSADRDCFRGKWQNRSMAVSGRESDEDLVDINSIESELEEAEAVNEADTRRRFIGSAYIMGSSGFFRSRTGSRRFVMSSLTSAQVTPGGISVSSARLRCPCQQHSILWDQARPAEAIDTGSDCAAE